MTGTETAYKPPALEIEKFFDGHTNAWGLFEDRFGKVRRQFVVDIDGTWDGETLQLDEQFWYSDGERDTRTWTLRKSGPDEWEGRANDVVGVAVGVASENAFNLRYRMDLKMKKRSLRVSFDDWMFLQPSGVLISRTKVKKFGLEVGSVTLTFQKRDIAPRAEANRSHLQPIAPVSNISAALTT